MTTSTELAKLYKPGDDGESLSNKLIRYDAVDSFLRKAFGSMPFTMLDFGSGQGRFGRFLATSDIKPTIQCLDSRYLDDRELRKQCIDNMAGLNSYPPAYSTSGLVLSKYDVVACIHVLQDVSSLREFHDLVETLDKYGKLVVMVVRCNTYRNRFSGIEKDLFLPSLSDVITTVTSVRDVQNWYIHSLADLSDNFLISFR